MFVPNDKNPALVPGFILFQHAPMRAKAKPAIHGRLSTRAMNP
jgi:hypothetical protein